MLKQMFKKILEWNHLYPVLLIVSIILIVNYPLLNPDISKRGGDWRNGDTPGYHFIDKYIIEDKSFPLWDHYTFSGRPLFGLGMPLNYPVTIFFALFLSPYGVMNTMLLIHMILAGVGMYFLANEFLKDHKSSFISGLIYGFSPYLMTALRHPFWIYGIAFIPLELFLAVRAFKRKNFIFYSVLLGITGALHFLSGGVLQWYYAVIFVSAFLAFKIFHKNWKNKIFKSAIIFFIFIAVMFSLSAVRFFPAQEFTSFT